MFHIVSLHVFQGIVHQERLCRSRLLLLLSRMFFQGSGHGGDCFIDLIHLARLEQISSHPELNCFSSILKIPVPGQNGDLHVGMF